MWRGRERGEVRSPLRPRLAGDRAADRDQYQADAEQDGGGAQYRRQRLTWLAQQHPRDASHPLRERAARPHPGERASGRQRLRRPRRHLGAASALT
jgi:hypothetical protein